MRTIVGGMLKSCLFARHIVHCIYCYQWLPLFVSMFLPSSRALNNGYGYDVGYWNHLRCCNSSFSRFLFIYPFCHRWLCPNSIYDFAICNLNTTYNIYMRLWRCELMIYGDIVEHCRSININKRDYAEGKRSELIFCVCRESEPYVNWGK